MLVRRFDTQRLSKFKKTAQGFLEGPANVTSVGVFTYHRADGSVQREYRPASEVFSADSLDTLATAPLTDLHPGVFVDPSNSKELGVGRLRGEPKQDGQFVSAKVLIEDAKAIEAVEKGDRAEISCGYVCDLEMTPGSFNGQRYDCIQKNIRYNHIALGPKGWGRQGSQVALRTDSQDAIAEIGVVETEELEHTGMDLVEIKIDGITCKVDKLAAELITKEFARKDSKISALETSLGAAETEKKAVQAKLDAAQDPKALQARVDARTALILSAGKILGEEKLDGLSDHEIRVKALQKADSKFSAEGKSEDYVAGAFGALEVKEKAAEESRASAHTDAKGAAGSEKKDAATSRKEAIAKKQSRWKGEAK